jgi:large subunit ribosomal protein L9
MAKRTKARQQMLKGPHGGMQLVLTEDVVNLGKQGDVVEVKPGYGRNYLIPRGMATVPTPHNLRLLERYKIKVKQAREARIADLKNLAAQIQNLRDVPIIEANATEDGHLYGSVGAAEISKVLKSRGLLIEPEMVKLEAGIKETGIYEIPLNLGFEIETTVKIGIAPAQK